MRRGGETSGVIFGWAVSNLAALSRKRGNLLARPRAMLTDLRALQRRGGWAWNWRGKKGKKVKGKGEVEKERRKGRGKKDKEEKEAVF